mmetsp:Transcript_21036/g.42525  ORF Transcript_21036/g.42525 Transcript_21036/m.42525 type:complete len:94 (-) Transcript_21036:470-751(-)
MLNQQWSGTASLGIGAAQMPQAKTDRSILPGNVLHFDQRKLQMLAKLSCLCNSGHRPLHGVKLLPSPSGGPPTTGHPRKRRDQRKVSRPNLRW